MLIRKLVCDWCSRSVEVRLKDGSSLNSDPIAEDAALLDGWRIIPAWWHDPPAPWGDSVCPECVGAARLAFEEVKRLRSAAVAAAVAAAACPIVEDVAEFRDAVDDFRDALHEANHDDVLRHNSAESLWVEHPESERIAAGLNAKKAAVCTHQRSVCFLRCGVERIRSESMLVWHPIPHADRVRWRERVFAFAGVKS